MARPVRTSRVQNKTDLKRMECGTLCSTEEKQHIYACVEVTYQGNKPILYWKGKAPGSWCWLDSIYQIMSWWFHGVRRFEKRPLVCLYNIVRVNFYTLAQSSPAKAFSVLHEYTLRAGHRTKLELSGQVRVSWLCSMFQSLQGT